MAYHLSSFSHVLHMLLYSVHSYTQKLLCDCVCVHLDPHLTVWNAKAIAGRIVFVLFKMMLSGGWACFAATTGD